MSTIHAVFTITSEGQPGFNQQVMKTLNHLVEETNKQQGCIVYKLIKDIPVPGICEQRANTYTLIEQWRSLQDVMQHFKKPHVQALKEIRAKFNIKSSGRFFQKIA